MSSSSDEVYFTQGFVRPPESKSVRLRLPLLRRFSNPFLPRRSSRFSEFAQPVDPIALRDQIDRILHSRSFRNKSQLRKLLEILFKNIDSQSALKPDLVIQELWPAETRTKRAADVATEMNRLRHALETYYEEEGKTDVVAIILPNRSASAADGTHEKRWIVALPRNGPEVHGPARPVAAPEATAGRNCVRETL